MPQVDGKKFPYTASGIKAARKAATKKKQQKKSMLKEYKK
tara:strand:- start:1278 stop:1397 length:120 start_codon:yes stop_codon:yes gene_type:complete